MKKIILCLCMILISVEIYSQEKSILVFDLINDSVDTLPMITYDTTIVSDYTNFFLGNINAPTELLAQNPPVVNTYPGSSFTYKKRASIDYDLINYPFRTSVKIAHIENDSLKNNCSGSLISRKHVLTAAHCISDVNSNSINKDSLKVFPVFDNGMPNVNFNSSDVTKIYFFKDWNISGEDFAVLELEEAIGDLTGWLSIGFNKIDSLLAQGIFYKFTYPSVTIPEIDLNAYNGDSLYYNYGNIDIVNSSTLGINGASAVLGESGSSIIKVVNEQAYISYGVLSLSYNLVHSKIKNWHFYTIKNIIENDLIALNPNPINETLTVYPNPVSNALYIKNEGENELIELFLFDSLGKKVLAIDKEEFNEAIDISNLLSGVYYLKLRTNTTIKTRKIIKI